MSQAWEVSEDGSLVIDIGSGPIRFYGKPPAEFCRLYPELGIECAPDQPAHVLPVSTGGSTMPRRLSDPEYVAFLDQVDLNSLNLPPWGGAIKWGGMDVLAYEAPAGVFLTDITGMDFDVRPEWEYNDLAGLWVWHLPQEAAATIVQRVTQLSEGINFGFEHLGGILLLTVGVFVFFELNHNFGKRGTA